jgi:tripartite-type tricarboxylate transporter receptor subunit TctC
MKTAVLKTAIKTTILAATAAAGVTLAAGTALAQGYPTRPIHFIVGYPPGGGSDTSARVTAQAMEKILGQSIVVENKPGAGSLVGAQYVQRAEPDGYTILFGNVTAFHPLFLKDGIDAGKAFDPITNLQVGGLIFASKLNAPFNTLQEMLAWSKANPGKLNFASVAPSADLYMAMFKAKTGLDFVGVPYKGDAPIITALLSGEVDVALSNTLAVLPQVQAGKMKAMWVSRSTRSSIAPNLPTLAELGVPGVVWEFYLGLWTPKGTPAAAVQRLQAAGIAAVKQPDIIEVYRKFGADSMGTTAAETLAAFNNEMKFWTEAAKLSNYQPQ